MSLDWERTRIVPSVSSLISVPCDEDVAAVVRLASAHCSGDELGEVLAMLGVDVLAVNGRELVLQ